VKIYLAMASYTGRPDVETQQSLVSSCLEARAAGVDVSLHMAVGNSIIPMVRNAFVTDFLHSDCTDLVMIDDDLAWEDGALVRLMSHTVDMVGGVYPKRQDKLEFPVRRIPGAKVDMATGLMEVAMLPAGFLRMSRQCLTRMVEAYPGLKYFDRGSKWKHSHALFWNDLAPGLDADNPDLPEVWGEDFTFCRRWREIGGAIHLDTLLTFKHIGRKAWSGCYAKTMPVAALFEAAE
jgi:hypothetical protein